MVTGGDDHSVRVWDLRQRQCSYVLPAHAGLVSEAKFDPTGEVRGSASGHYERRGPWEVWNKLEGKRGEAGGNGREMPGRRRGSRIKNKG